MLNKKRKSIITGSILGLTTISTAIGLGVGLNQTKQTQINQIESKIDSNQSQVLIKKENKTKDFSTKPLKEEVKQEKSSNSKPKELNHTILETITTTDFNTNTSINDDIKYRWN